MTRTIVLLIVGVLVGMIAGYYVAAKQRPRIVGSSSSSPPIVDASAAERIQTGGADVRLMGGGELPTLELVSMPGGV